jgi:hypothetical protein
MRIRTAARVMTGILVTSIPDPEISNITFIIYLGSLSQNSICNFSPREL